MQKNKKIITLIGGGTGNVTLLTGLRPYLSEVTLNVIVTTADSGGSTGRLVDEHGTLPSGDIAKCLVALSGQPETIREGLVYRFNQSEKNADAITAIKEVLFKTEEGRNLMPVFEEIAMGLSGHTLMNLIITAWEKNGGRKNIIRTLSEWWNVQGSVIPASYDNLTLIAETVNNVKYTGEHLIDMVLHDDQIKKVYYQHRPTVNPDAIQALIESDLIILSPGDLYTSIMPVLIIDEIRRSVKQANAPVLLIVPLMNKFGHTNGFTVQQYINYYAQYLGKESIEYVLHNNMTPSEDLLCLYQTEAEFVRMDDEPIHAATTLLQANIISPHAAQQPKADVVPRSLIRHDPYATGSIIFEIIKSFSHS